MEKKFTDEAGTGHNKSFLKEILTQNDSIAMKKKKVFRKR